LSSPYVPSPLYPARAGWSGSSNKEGDPKGLYRARAGVVRMMKRAAKSTRPLPRTRGGGSSYAVAVPAILYSAPRVRRWSGINEIEVLCPARAGWSGGELRGGSGGDLCPARAGVVRPFVRSFIHIYHACGRLNAPLVRTRADGGRRPRAPGCAATSAPRRRGGPWPYNIRPSSAYATFSRAVYMVKKWVRGDQTQTTHRLTRT